MAIKEVDFIPDANGRHLNSYKAMVSADIREAVEKHISTFELVGDYNYKYLATYARDVAHKYFREQIYTPAKNYVIDTLMKELGRADVKCVWSDRDDEIRAIRVKSVTQADRIHVYVEIDYDFIDGYRDNLLRESRIENGKRQSVI